MTRAASFARLTRAGNKGTLLMFIEVNSMCKGLEVLTIWVDLIVFQVFSSLFVEDPIFVCLRKNLH